MQRVRRALTFFFLLVFSAIFLAFAVANRDFVTFSFFPLAYSFEMPKFLFALSCFACGVIIGGLLLSFGLAKSKRQLKHERQRVRALDNEVKALRMEKNSAASVALIS